MQHEPKARMPGLVGLILLVAGAAALWWGLDRWEHRVAWLSVETPRRAVAGQKLPLRAHLAPLAEPTRLCADLHWGTTRDTTMGYLSTGGSQAVSKAGGTFDFEMKIPPTQEVRFVTGVLFLSPTGNWQDHTLSAVTEVIAVSGNPADKAEGRLEPLRVFLPEDGTTGHQRPAAAPRWLTALLFLVAAMAAWGGGVSASESGAGSRRGNLWWRVLVVAMALACLWELLGMESWLGAKARAMARTEDLYYPRAVFQKVVISMTIAATIIFFLFIQRVNRSNRLLLTALALYLVISGVNLVSWHPIDKIADLSWHGLTLVQSLKLGCALLILFPFGKDAVQKARGHPTRHAQ
jgi:hypothetical protein